jgi:hypothetical protein
LAAYLLIYGVKQSGERDSVVGAVRSEIRELQHGELAFLNFLMILFTLSLLFIFH